MNHPKIDLALLNNLTQELNDELAKANKIKELNNKNPSDYIVGISKCMGLATAIAIESAALSHDFLQDIKVSSSVSGAEATLPLDPSKAADVFGDFFADLKKKN